jgi:transposase
MKIESLDDLPFLGCQFARCGLSAQLDKHFPDHGHWSGISGGQLAVGWLLFILSEADHRLSHVEDWASARLETLGAILEEAELRAIDFSDDRLGRLLDRYSDDASWVSFEQALGSQLLQVYQINPPPQGDASPYNIIRTDSFNAPQFRQPGELFTHGYSKQRRSDQPFCKVMVSTLDNSMLPLAVEIVKGAGPDVEHYMSNIKRVQAILPQRGNLYVGDSQLGSIGNRLAIHSSGDYYLMPLNRKQCSLSELHGYLQQIEGPLHDLPGIFTANDDKRQAAYFKEVSTRLNITNETLENHTEWTERRILVYSPNYAEGLIKSFNNRLDEAQEAIQNLMISKKGRKNPKTLEDLQLRKDRIVRQYELEGCFEISCIQMVEYVEVRRHKTRASETREHITLHLEIKRNDEFIEKYRRLLGWQIYGTNVPENLIQTGTLVKCYRDEYRIEHLFDELINRNIGLLPLFLKKESRIKGLIRLLSVAIRFTVLIQYRIRAQMDQNGESINGIYPGNKGRSTASPTTSMILRAFRGVAIAWVEINDNRFVQMTPLTTIQEKLLRYIDGADAYQRILEVLKSNSHLRET